MVRVDFRASVNFIQDLDDPMSVATSRKKVELARAVRIVLSKHRHGQTPSIYGRNLNLIGIAAIRAVREMKGFPEELH